jgi:integrase
MTETKQTKGWVTQYGGKWFARLDYHNAEGKHRQVKRTAKDEQDAQRILDSLLADQHVNSTGISTLVPHSPASQMTFDQLASFFRNRYITEAVFVGGRKIVGYINTTTAKALITVAEDFFRGRTLSSISYSDLENFLNHRLLTKTRTDQQRSIATINKELGFLRRVLNVAVQEEWIAKNPFQKGRPLILHSAENKRTRILSADEEVRLLAACTGRNAHLKNIIICALDSGIRRGELFRLCWGDVDFVRGRLLAVNFKGTTRSEREVPLSDRLKATLMQMTGNGKVPAESVFGIKTNVKHSFESARTAAKLKDFTFHDLRHTFCTRLIQRGVPLPFVARVAGHSQITTTYRYINESEDSMRVIENALN